MKISSRKKAAILATVLSGCVFSNSVDAANIGVVGATDFSSTDVGIIEGSYVTSTINTTPINAVLTGYNGDTSIYNLVDGDKNSIWIRQYTYSQTNLVPNVNVNSQGDWNSEIQSGEIKGAPNAHGVATKNGFVYVADYDNGAIGVGKITDTGIADFSQSHHINLKEDILKYAGFDMQHEWAGELYAKGESILVDGDSLYVLVNIDTYDASGGNWSNYFEYSNSYLMKYDINRDGTLSFNSCAEMGKNTDRSRLNKYNDHIFATAIGGYQNFGVPNEETSLNVATVDKNNGWISSSNAITLPDNVKNICDWNGNEGTEFRNLKILPNGTAYVLCYAQGWDGATSHPFIFKTTVSNLLSDNPVDWETFSEGDIAGYFNDIDAEYYTKRLWVQNGNTIQVYLDGVAEPIVFTAGDFGNNPYYGMIQSWAVIKPDTLTGNIAKLHESETKVVNDNAIWKDATLTNQITSITTLNNDAVIALGNEKLGDLNNNILAAVYAKDGNVTVDAAGKKLGLQVENTIGTPVGIYAGNGKTAEVTAGTVNIITKGMEGGNSLNNAIMLDAVAEGEQSAITINGNVNIAMTGGYGGNGIAVQKTDRLLDETIDVYDDWNYNTITLREASYTAEEAAVITINGDVSIKGEDNQTWGIKVNEENVLSRFNNAGVLTSVNKSVVNINGNVDMDVYGNGVTVNAEDSSVTIAKGGQITVPQGTNYGYYTLAAYNGTINMNMGADGKTVGTDDVVLNGDIFALKDGSINLALVTADSELNGIVDSAGTTNICLQNGATWNNVQNNERYALDYEDQGNGSFDKNGDYIGVSHVTNLRGGNSYENAGVINQAVNSNNLTIDNYSGNTIVAYNHNTNSPTEIYGGDVTIKSAESDSAITLRTDSAGIEFANAESVENVLDALANKLYYTGYVTGERNLDGYVEIAEGITSSSVRKAYGHIGYNEKDGQGSFAGNVENIEPDSQTQDSFTAPIFGDASKDTAYVEDKVLKDGVYEFTKEETTITVANNTIAGGPWVNSGVGAAISSVGEGNKTTIGLNENKLNVIATHSSNHSTGISAINKGVVEVNNPGDITIDATGAGQTAAIFANGGGEVYIHNGECGTVVVRAHASNVDNGAVIKTMNGANGVESKIIIDGMVDVVADKNNGANEAVSAVASRIEIGGGNIEARNGAWAAIRAYGEFVSQNYGIVNVNVAKDEDGNIIGAGNRKTTITGDFVTNGGMGTKGQISVGLSGEDSYWHGKYTDNDGYGVTPGQLGSVNLWIEDGAHWTGYSSGSVNVNITGEGSYWDGYSTSSKMLLNLSDGAIWKNSNASQTSSIGNFIGDGGYIENAGGVTIDNYSGNTTVIYKHDAETPTNILGGDVTIKSAAENSAITLRTDNTGITIEDTEQVNSVLDSLAHKLYYTAYINKTQDNLDGYVEIAEGLTSSSVSKAVGEIEFSEETGQGSLKVDVPSEPDVPTEPDVPIEPDTPSDPDTPTEPEQPVQKPVEEEIKGAITGDSLTDTTNPDNPYKDLVSTDENNNTVIDFGKLDKDEVGEDKPDSEKVDKVKIESEESEGGKNSVIAAAHSKPVILDLAGKDLDVSGDATNEAVGIQATGGDVTIKNAGAVTITAKAENGSASAIYAKGADDKANVTIENTGTLKLVANGNANDAVLHADVNSNVNITGNVDITETNGKVAVEVANNSSVTIGGGVIGDADGVAVQVTENGKINIGGNDKVNIKGKIIFGVAAKTENEELAPVMYSRMLMRSLPEANVNVDLTTAGSTLEDNLEYQGDGTNNVANVQISGEGSAWTADSIGGISLNVVLDNSGVWKGYHEDDKDYSALNMQISNGAQWYNEATDATTIDKLVGADVNDKDAKTGFIRMSEAKEAGLTVKDYSGETTFIYNHDTENNILGGDVTINKAADGSIVNVRTGSIGSMDKKEISKVLQALAEKVIAKDAEGNVLDNADKISGQAQIAEGMITSSNSLRFGDIKFDTGSGVVDEASINYGATAGDYETAMMSGAKSAMTSSVMMWRAEANDIMKRMGDLRMAEGEQGIWAKYYGTKQEMEAQNAKYTNNYKAYQLGYDKKVGDWTVGVAASYGDGESTYANGRGENSVVSLGLYGAWNGNDGQYVDVIMKRSKLDNEYNLNGNVFIGQIEADYETWATSVSAEYGKRFETKKGFYVEPNAELTLGRVEGESYNTSLSLGGERLNVQQDDYDTLVGRLGLRIGQKLDKASYYAKFAVAKEFAGDFDTKYSTVGKFGAIETKETSMSFKDTWYEMQIGGTAQLNDNSYIYASYERNFGADVEQKWRIDAGLRFSF